MTDEQQDLDYVSGAVVRRAREAKGWSLRDLAKKLGDGTHFTTIGKIERGDVRLTIERFVQFASALDLPSMAIISPSLAGGDVKMVPIFNAFPYNLMSEIDKELVTARVPIISTRKNLIGYGIFPKDNAFVAHAFSYVIVDLDDTGLVSDYLYCLHVDEDDVEYCFYREGPSRFEDWHLAENSSTFLVGKRSFQVIGRIIQIVLGVANLDTTVDGS